MVSDGALPVGPIKKAPGSLRRPWPSQFSKSAITKQSGRPSDCLQNS